ncbi:MAG: hypothetical protein Q9168_005462 [Polycauliona sp. 1 TL-2023]
MADKPPAPVEGAAGAAKDVLPIPQPKPAGNPVFRMMGLPNFRFKLPSRNWLIFLSVTGSFTTAVLYDRYHKKRAQQRWCNLVSHIAREPLPMTQMPRKITIFLSAPPGDSIRAAREHFHEYVKPVLAAAAMDWDVIEGRREGDVRAGLAEKIRKRRRKDGEKSVRGEETESSEEKEDLVQELRITTGVKDWEGIQGDLVLGRHTWKEYVRGLHEGWLGPLDAPPDPSVTSTPSADASSLPTEKPSTADDEPAISDTLQTSNPSTATTDPAKPSAETPQSEAKKEEKPKTPAQIPPYMSTSAYPSAPIAPTVPNTLPPSTILPLPHLLGFLNTPIRIYRFLNRRHLADETGREVAALVLASYVRPFDSQAESTGSPPLPGLEDSRQNQRSDNPTEHGRRDPAGVLEGEERDWHKVAWKRYQGEPERVWRNNMVLDPRIGERMRRFDLLEVEKDKAREDDGVDPAAKGLWANIKERIGWEEDRTIRGWEDGTVGGESE